MDGSKWENMSKVCDDHITYSTNKRCLRFYQICVHVAQNVIAHGLGSNDGILLLRCVQAYVELDILAGFEIHTTESIAWGSVVLKNFAKLAEVKCFNSLLRPMLTWSNRNIAR